MRRNGPAPVPVERRARLGDPGNKTGGIPAVPALAPAVVHGEIPEPTRTLGKQGRAAWNRAFQAAYWIAESDLAMLLVACEAEDEYVITRAKVLTDPDATWRDRIALERIRKQLIDLYDLLGFSPTSRTRLQLGAVKTATLTDALVSRHSGADDQREEFQDVSTTITLDDIEPTGGAE